MERSIKRSLAILIILVGIIPAQGQSAIYADTLELARSEAEGILLKENLFLLAEHLSVSQAEAQLLQARLWPNPELTISEVNLWATRRQLENGEALPPLVNNVGKNQQVGLQLEQLILTAGKRRKLMDMEKVSAEMAREYLQELLRNLKLEFRTSVYRLQYYQYYRDTYTQQRTSVENLLTAYRHQVQQGNIGRGAYIRLKALELQINKELTELEKDYLDVQAELKLLLNIPATTWLRVTIDNLEPDIKRIESLDFASLVTQALDHRPDLRLAQLEMNYNEKNYAFQRAQRIPDLTMIASYDRGGNFIQDFFGIGVGVNLPLFNRNQGSIAIARIGVEKSTVMARQVTNQVEADVARALQELLITKQLYESIESDYESNLEALLESYTLNFRERNINILEYLDFQETYLENKKILIEVMRDMHLSLEELQYLIGSEFE